MSVSFKLWKEKFIDALDNLRLVSRLRILVRRLFWTSSFRSFTFNPKPQSMCGFKFLSFDDICMISLLPGLCPPMAQSHLSNLRENHINPFSPSSLLQKNSLRKTLWLCDHEDRPQTCYLILWTLKHSWYGKLEWSSKIYIFKEDVRAVKWMTYK